MSRLATFLEIVIIQIDSRSNINTGHLFTSKIQEIATCRFYFYFYLVLEFIINIIHVYTKMTNV
ncbi:hypothetical protein C2G38_433120 [Gigaspora rosea]|uniref:Uncharacterized protein n=1 Tax=Gigaspora rosea TaxID=44941 RepID=A0A397VSY6_9GLOM|nr:hypothetical protein C2G38_433120 [Gigaspora rosea]